MSDGDLKVTIETTEDGNILFTAGMFCYSWKEWETIIEKAEPLTQYLKYLKVRKNEKQKE